MIEIKIFKNSPVPFSLKYITRVINTASFVESKLRGKVEITLLNELEMSKINKEYRGFSKPTDVLSFVYHDVIKKLQKKPFIIPFLEKNNQNPTGYVYLCPPYIKKQAVYFSVSFKEEFLRMLIHGLLHIAGHDHYKKKETKKMFELQDAILKKVL